MNSSPASDFSPSPETAPVPPRKGRPKLRLMKLVRRIHLYTGLILLPWVIFFGFSGMLFNHPEFGPTEILARLDGSLAEKQGFKPLDAEALAERVVAALNEGEGSGQYRRAKPGDAVIEGKYVLHGASGDGSIALTLDPRDGGAVVTMTPETPKASAPPFLSTPLPQPEGLEKDALQSLANGLLDTGGIKPLGPLELSPRGGAELRFRLESEESGQEWNLSWNIAAGRLSAREHGVGEGPDLYSVLTRFHKTHHYPGQMGARWLWTALADATGLTMVFWGISGAIMWWQLKPTRVLGVAGLSVAGVLALFVFAGTYSQIHWVPREVRPAPAEARPGNPGKGKSANSISDRPAPGPNRGS